MITFTNHSDSFPRGIILSHWDTKHENWTLNPRLNRELEYTAEQPLQLLPPFQHQHWPSDDDCDDEDAMAAYLPTTAPAQDKVEFEHIFHKFNDELGTRKSDIFSIFQLIHFLNTKTNN